MPWQMLQKLKEDEDAEERPAAAELGSLRNTDWVRLRCRARGLCRGCAGGLTVCPSVPRPGCGCS